MNLGVLKVNGGTLNFSHLTGQLCLYHQPENTPPSNTSPANNPNPSTPNKTNTDNFGSFGLASWIGITLVVLFGVIVVLLVIIAIVMWRKNVPQFNSSLNTYSYDG